MRKLTLAFAVLVCLLSACVDTMPPTTPYPFGHPCLDPLLVNDASCQ